MTDRNSKRRFEAGQSLEARKHVLATLPVFVPGLSLMAFWLGGESALVAVAIGAPIVLGLFLYFTKEPEDAMARRGLAGVLAPAAFHAVSKQHLDAARENGTRSAVFMLRVDDFQELLDHYGKAAMDSVLDQIARRIRSSLRTGDEISLIDQDTFAACLTPQPTLDLEICLELAGRINRNIAEPYAVDGTAVYLTVSIGFCQLGRESAHYATKDKDQDPVIVCAQAALLSARAAAPGAIRAYSHETRVPPKKNATNKPDAVEALDAGEITAWFQPQISTDTGRITGFEALARWMHPTLGMLPPTEFLPQLESAGRMSRLSEVILFNALTAIRAWDEVGADVGQVGVNFSTDELSDPGLVEKLRWELDRFELAPNRLAIEILETVVAQGPEDVVTRNIKGLSELGCCIDLDDYGTGHASLSSIRRFAVSRIKIDRSFVMRSDRDPEQQRMIRAILTMAEKLELETLAEGVETVGEHSLLAQLGCTHVQGFGIGRPMPFEKTLDWIKEHNSKLQDPPNIGRATG